MQPDHMGGEEVRRFGRRRELGEGYKMDHLREPVDHGQDGVVALGDRETGDKIQGNVRPWSTRGR